MSACLTYAEALTAALRGHHIRRSGWNGAGLTVYMYQPPPTDNGPTVPFMVIRNPATHPTAPGLIAPWMPSQTDQMAADWDIVKLA